MSGQSKVLASTALALVAMGIAVFGMAWFTMRLDVAGNMAGAIGSARIHIGLHDATACMPDGSCATMALSNFDGLFPTMATFTFWISIVLGLIVAYQAVQRVLTGQAGEALSRVGYVLIIMAFGGCILAGFTFAPETGQAEVVSAVVHRTFAPGLLILGYIASGAALVLSTTNDDFAPTMTPIVIAKPRAVLSEPIVPLAKSRVITPPVITIEMPPIEKEEPPTIKRTGLRFAATRLAFHKSGIDAQREDGSTPRVLWADIVGIVARRLPAEPPHAGETFVDIVSIAGATIRYLPSATEVVGTEQQASLATGDESERARTFVQLVAMACPEARLDSATRTFLGGRGPAAQLPSIDTLAQHDERLS